MAGQSHGKGTLFHRERRFALAVHSGLLRPVCQTWPSPALLNPHCGLGQQSAAISDICFSVSDAICSL